VLLGPFFYIQALGVKLLDLSLYGEGMRVAAGEVITKQPVKCIGPEVKINKPLFKYRRAYAPGNALLREPRGEDHP
jgi:hypothetical protein